MPTLWGTIAVFAVIVALSSYGVLVDAGIQGGMRDVSAFIVLIAAILLLVHCLQRLRRLLSSR